jgi:putative spermidine/putrescine transport system permease protein
MVYLKRLPRPLLAIAVLAYFLFPMVAVCLYSFSARWTQHVLPDSYTLTYWHDGLRDRHLRSVVFRTTWLALLVLVLDIFLVVPAVYWQRVRNPRIRIVTELAAAIPFVLPFLVIAYGVLDLVGKYRPSLLGTWYLLLLCHAAIAFPFLYWAVDGAMAAANIVRLNEAAQLCGADPVQTLRYVVIPNIGPGLATGGMLVFATSFGEFALAQLLVGARFENVSLYSLALLTSYTNQFGTLAVLTVITFVLLFVISAAVVFLNRGQTTRLLPGARAMAGER